MSAVYEVRDLSCRRGAREILHGVTLDVTAGRVLALVGPNGAGKSTLLAALSGDLATSAGSVSFLGKPLDAWSERELARHRAVLLQANEVSFAFTVREVVEMARSPWWGKGSADNDEAIVEQALETTDTLHLADRRFIALSGGEKARVSLARVLAQTTDVILLDEPTAALDLRHQEDVMSMARRLAAEGRTIIVVVHDLSLATAYADEVAVVDGGRLVAHGAPADVVTVDQVWQTYGVRVRIAVDPEDGQLMVIPRRPALH